MGTDNIDLTQLFDRQFIVPQQGVPRVLSEIKDERKLARNRIMYLRKLHQYDRPRPEDRPQTDATSSVA